jgi:hypothetical protein
LFKLFAQKEQALKEFERHKEGVAAVGREICDDLNIPYSEWSEYAVDTTTGKLQKVT